MTNNYIWIIRTWSKVIKLLIIVSGCFIPSGLPCSSLTIWYVWTAGINISTFRPGLIHIFILVISLYCYLHLKSPLLCVSLSGFHCDLYCHCFVFVFVILLYYILLCLLGCFIPYFVSISSLLFFYFLYISILSVLWPLIQDCFLHLHYVVFAISH